MSHQLIRSLIEQRLASWASARAPALRVAYENVTFAAQAGETYLKAYAIPADTGSDTLAGDHKRYTGLFQVTVVAPAGKGSGAAGGIVGELAALFPLYDRLAKDGFEVVILTPVDAGPGIVEGATYSVAASFQYRADTE